MLILGMKNKLIFMRSSTCKIVFFAVTFFLLGIVSRYFVNSVYSSSESKEVEIPIPLQRRSINWKDRKIDFGDITSGNENDLKFKPFLDKLAKGIIPEDWNIELKKILEIQNKMEKRRVLFVFFPKWAETDFATAMATAGKLGTFAYEIRKEILCQLAASDPKAALAYYENHSDALANHSYVIGEIAKNWAKSSPEEAFAWCFTFDNKRGVRFDVLTEFMGGIQLKDPSQVKGYIEKINVELGYVPNTIITNWVRSNPNEAIDWITSVEDKDSSYMKEAILGLADKNMKMAEDLIPTLPQHKQMSVISDISDKINHTRGAEAALSWIMERVPLENIHTGLLLPVSSWASNNPEDSKQWVQKLPSSPTKDEAISLYAEALTAHSSFDAALDMVNSMEDSNKKEEVLKKTIKRWNDRNPEEFSKWLESSTHSDQIKSFLTNESVQ